MVGYYKAYDEYNNIVHINDTVNRPKLDKYYIFENKCFELIAKRGEIRAWHFARRPIEGSQHNGVGGGVCESEIHSIIKHYIAEGCIKYINNKNRIVLKLKPLVYSSIFGEKILYDLLQDVDKVKIEAPYKERKPDITLYKNGKAIRVVEVVYDHPVSIEALSLYREDKIDVVTVNVSQFTDDDVSSLINDTIDGVTTFKDWFRFKSKVHIYLNNMGCINDFTRETNNLKTEYSKLVDEAIKLNSDYKILLNDIKAIITNVNLAYYTCEGFETLKVDFDDVVSEKNSIYEDYKCLVTDLKEIVSRVNRLVGYNNKLLRYWVKSDKQYSCELKKKQKKEEEELRVKEYQEWLKQEEVRQQKEREARRIMLEKYYENLRQGEIRKKKAVKIEEERRRKEEVDKKNTVKKHVNRRAAQGYKSGVSSLDFFSTTVSENKQGIIVSDSSNLVTDDEGFEKFLKEEGY